MFQPRVVDIYSLTTIQSDTFERAKAAGVWGIIHKASEGNTYKDPKYAQRRKMVEDAGLLWGAYHFNYGNDVKQQVDNFLDSAQPDANTLVVLDFEDHKVNMDIQYAVAFMRSVEDKLGRSCAIYSGNRLKTYIGQLGQDDFAYITQKKLWLAQYGPKAQLPKGFDKYFLWQYSGDGIGPMPHTVDGFGPGQDMNVYDGTQEQLAQQWVD